MNAREKTNRDNEIVAARMRGQSWMTIAANYGLSERQCQTILEDYRASHPRLRQRDPIEIVDDMLDHYQGAQEEWRKSRPPANTTRPGLAPFALAWTHWQRKRTC